MNHKIGLLDAKWDFIDGDEALVEIERGLDLDEDAVSRPRIEVGEGESSGDGGGGGGEGSGDEAGEGSNKDPTTTTKTTLETYTVRKWIAFFKTATAASRFVRTWHKRIYVPRRPLSDSNSNLSSPGGTTESGGNQHQQQRTEFESTPAIINAELLW